MAPLLPDRDRSPVNWRLPEEALTTFVNAPLDQQDPAAQLPRARSSGASTASSRTSKKRIDRIKNAFGTATNYSTGVLQPANLGGESTSATVA